jgi:hypothetical protein
VLRTNLSTRPFYNDRPIRVGIALAVVAVAAFSLYNGARILTLTQRNRELAERADAAEARTRELRTRADTVRKALAQEDVTVVQAAAREANLLIARRAFSWTDLFNRFEETLPADVRIATVQPQQDDQGRMLVAVTVQSRRVEDLDEFIERLEQTGAFRGVLSRQESVDESGTLLSVIQGYYTPPAVAPAGGAVPAGPPRNASPGQPAASGTTP